MNVQEKQFSCLTFEFRKIFRFATLNHCNFKYFNNEFNPNNFLNVRYFEIYIFLCNTVWYILTNLYIKQKIYPVLPCRNEVITATKK